MVLLRFGRKPKNRYERTFYELAEAKGWTVTKRGWPDFFCEHPETGRVMCVEVKPAGVPLKREQQILMERLAALGVDCYRWSPDEGLVKVNGQGARMPRSL